MSDREKFSVKNNLLRQALPVIAVMLCILMLAGCSQMSEPEKKVAKELDALKHSESLGSEVITLRDTLPKEGRQDLDTFLDELRDFDYEIIGSRAKSDCTVVSVRIKTCEFGKEYLAAWTDYLKSHKEGPTDDAAAAAFYELLFSKLAGIESKGYIRDIEIVCADPLDNGEWIANIKDNEDLQDAVFGGMMGEMKALAAE